MAADTGLSSYGAVIKGNVPINGRMTGVALCRGIDM